MKNQLEDFIRNNREAFDDLEPSEKSWKNIDASIRVGRKSIWGSVVVWRAAAIVFMVLSAALMVPRFWGGTVNRIAGDSSLKEFNDVEAYYVQQISEKVEMIDTFRKNEGLNGMTQDFQQLEAMYMVLKEEMKNRPSQKVKDALVLNLLVRIDLLNQQLHHLESELRGQDKKKADQDGNV